MPKSRTLALARQSEAVALFRRGSTFEQIASTVGFANRGTAHRVVTRAYRDQLVEDIDQHRAMEIRRLDAIQAALWECMELGDVCAAKLILEVCRERSKLLGLYDHPPQQARMLVNPSLGNPGKATLNAEVAQNDEKAA